jgi:protein TonB
MTHQTVAISNPSLRVARRFTLAHGLAASLMLHGAVCLAMLLDLWPAEEEPQSLLFELDGALSDSQTEETTEHDVKGETPQDNQVAEAARSETEPQPEREQDPQGEIAEDTPKTAARAQQKQEAKAGVENATGGEEQQKAQTIAKPQQTEEDRVTAYVKQLSKRIQRRLVYPSEARAAGLQGAATVSFTISATGHLVPSSLRIVAGSGQPQLDAGALKTVRAASPFAPPPREMNVAVAVGFARKR